MFGQASFVGPIITLFQANPPFKLSKKPILSILALKYPRSNIDVFGPGLSANLISNLIKKTRYRMVI